MSGGPWRDRTIIPPAPILPAREPVRVVAWIVAAAWLCVLGCVAGAGWIVVRVALRVLP